MVSRIEPGEDEEPPQLLEAEIPDVSKFERSKVPITLLTGYLGAGKSTLLQYILKENHGYRIAVCMNDFGDTTDIESKALTFSGSNSSESTSSFLSLPNGCLCCSVKDMGIAAIEEMVASAPGGVDWVVVELTGVADPAPIVRSFWSNEEMGDLILDGVVCVVDSRNVLNQLAEKKAPGEINECQKQVACADVILLNKIDLVTEDQLRDVKTVVKRLNPTLRMHHTTNSQVPLEEMFNIRAFSNSDVTDIRQIEGQPDHSRTFECLHNHDHDQGASLHSKITTALIPLPTLACSQFDKLNSFLESLLWSNQFPSTSSPAPDILRTKGYITVDDGRAFVLQGVTDLFELTKVDDKKGEKVQGKIVFIGRGVTGEVKHKLEKWVGL
ncbi:uncharacterized protein L203_100235 [Cryptococcus depauperatus CBS 7841]|uniref:Uncharacterized protein n=1 Tax=Cryptococcus depauperatus CBS 7841 TaxID=1295531 RepID=A0A1E3IZ88_9TREE|nr:cytoplasmic protein [Cryptococcus depauperatus CBS 7841]